MNTQLAIGGTLLFIGNARVVDNTDPLGHVRPPPRAEDGLGRERRRLDPVHPRDARLRDGGERARRARAAEEAAVGVLPQQPVRDVLVREQPEQAPRADRGGGRGQHPLRDRLPSSDVPLPEPAGRRSRRRWRRSRPRRARRSSARTHASSTGSETRARACTTIGHWVGGKPVAGTSGRSGPVFDPARGEQTGRVALASAAEVADVVKVAAGASARGAHRRSSRRAGVMFRLRELIDTHRDDLAAIVTREHGKVLDDARGEVARGLECVEFACGIPHLLKGAHSSEVSRGVDVHTVLQPRRRRRRHHAVQLPGHGAAVDAGERGRVRERVRAEALGEGSVGLAAAGGAGPASRVPRRRRQRRPGRREAVDALLDPSRHRRGLVRRQHARSPATSTRRARAKGSACRRSAERRTTWSCCPTPTSTPPPTPPCPRRTARPASAAWRSRSSSRSDPSPPPPPRRDGADRDDDRDRHAALPRRTVGRGDRGVGGGGDVGVGQHHHVVLRAPERLDPLTVARAGLVDVAGDRGAADERHRVDVGMGQAARSRPRRHPAPR